MIFATLLICQEAQLYPVQSFRDNVAANSTNCVFENRPNHSCAFRNGLVAASIEA